MTRAAIVLLTVSLATAGCGWFDDPAPNEARLVVQGESGITVRLVVSTKFARSTRSRGKSS
jgi:hypothetical protein